MDTQVNNTVVVTELPISNAMRSKAAVVELVTTRIPANRYGLPEGYYRPDLLPNDIESLTRHTILDEDGTEIILPTAPTDPTTGNPTVLPEDMLDESVLDSAFVQLAYDEGFPITPSGMPFWSPLEFEPPMAHAVFQSYLDSGRTGLRMISSLADKYALEDLLVYFHLFYWAPRTKAYDLFHAVSERKDRAIKITEMQSDHLTQANKLSEIVTTYIEGGDFEELLTPKVALEALKLATQLQRLSHGLPASTPAHPNALGGGSQEHSHTPVEVIINQLIGPQTSAETTIQQRSGKEREAAMRDRLLSDPETAKLAQDLLLKIGTPKPNKGRTGTDG